MINCPHCYSKEISNRSRLTARGYRTFFCNFCHRGFNERSNSPFNRRLTTPCFAAGSYQVIPTGLHKDYFLVQGDIQSEPVQNIARYKNYLIRVLFGKFLRYRVAIYSQTAVVFPICFKTKRQIVTCLGKVA